MKKIKISSIIILCSLLLTLMLGLKSNLISFKNQANDIPPLTFPQLGESGPQKNFPYEITTSTTFDKEIEVYKLESKNIDKVKFKEIAKKFSLYPHDDKISYSKENGYLYREGDSSYINVEESGRTIYSFCNEDNLSEKDNTMLPSDSEARKIAKRFLEDRELLPRDFYISSIGEGLVRELEDGTKDILNKQVIFHRKVNGKEVLGVSRIQVDVGKNGVERVAILYQDIVPYTKKSLKSVENALEDVKNNKGLEYFEKNLQPIKCGINKIELAYYEQPNSTEESFLYPIYKFTGKIVDDKGQEGEYIALVQATKE